MPFLALLAITMVFSIISNVASGLIGAFAEGQGAVGAFFVVAWAVVQIIVGLWLTVANYRMLLRLIRKQMIDWKAIFALDGALMGNLFLAGILMAVGVLLGFIAFIIPGIILSLGWTFYALLMTDERATVVSSLRGSWRMTRGHRGRLFLFQLLMFVLVVFPFVIAAVLVGGSFASSGAVSGALRAVMAIAGVILGILSIIWVMAVAFAGTFAQVWIYEQLKAHAPELDLQKIA